MHEPRSARTGCEPRVAEVVAKSVPKGEFPLTFCGGTNWVHAIGRSMKEAPEDCPVRWARGRSIETAVSKRVAKNSRVTHSSRHSRADVRELWSACVGCSPRVADVVAKSVPKGSGR